MNDKLREIQKQKRYDDYYMDIAVRTGKMSYSTRNKVGCIIVKDGNIISFGWNGTPFGFDNCCEDENGITKDNVIHGEMNAISKLARSTGNGEDATMFVTLSPCTYCSRLIIQTKIARVVYLEEYRDLGGIRLLKDAGVIVDRHVY